MGRQPAPHHFPPRVRGTIWPPPHAPYGQGRRPACGTLHADVLGARLHGAHFCHEVLDVNVVRRPRRQGWGAAVAMAEALTIGCLCPRDCGAGKSALGGKWNQPCLTPCPFRAGWWAVAGLQRGQRMDGQIGWPSPMPRKRPTQNGARRSQSHASENGEATPAKTMLYNSITQPARRAP